MQKTALNLAAIISAALLTACGGSSDETVANALVPAPTEPNAAEVEAFNASKQRREKTDVIGNGDWQPSSISVNGRTLRRTSGDRSNAVAEYDFRSLPAGFAAYNGTYTDRYGSLPVKVRSYQGFRSGVAAAYFENNRTAYIEEYGVSTPPAALPAAGRATYNGIAFDHSDRGSFTYHVDFGAKTGQGHIDGLKYKYGDIALAAGKITQEKQLDGSSETLIKGKASAATGSSFDYALTFFGNRAEEIAGYAVNDEQEGFAMHGTRGAITE